MCSGVIQGCASAPSFASQDFPAALFVYVRSENLALMINPCLDAQFLQVVVKSFEHVVADADEILDALRLELILAGGRSGHDEDGPGPSSSL